MLEVKTNNKKGFIYAEDGDGLDVSYPQSRTRRGRVCKQMAHTLTGGGYEKDFNLDNAVLSVEGVCRCINAHVGKGTPPIIVVKGTEGWKKKDKPK